MYFWERQKQSLTGVNVKGSNDEQIAWREPDFTLEDEGAALEDVSVGRQRNSQLVEVAARCLNKAWKGWRDQLLYKKSQKVVEDLP